MKKKKIDKIQTWLRFRVKYLFISKIIYKKIFLRLLNKISKLFFGAREILGLYEENFFAQSILRKLPLYIIEELYRTILTILLIQRFLLICNCNNLLQP